MYLAILGGRAQVRKTPEDYMEMAKEEVAGKKKCSFIESGGIWKERLR